MKTRNFTLQEFVSILNLLCKGNFILSKNFKKKLKETQFYEPTCGFDTCNQKIQSDSNLHAAN